MDVPIIHIEMVNGVAMIKGRSIKVRMIAELHLEGGATIEHLMERYQLTPAEVHSALAYYYDHRETFEQAKRELEPLVDTAKRETQINLEKMRSRAKQNKP